RAARCGCASACRRSDQSCSCVTSVLRFSSSPACLDDAGNLAAHGDVAELVASEAEFAKHAARPPGELAAVAQAGGTRIPGQLLELAPRSCLVLVGPLGAAQDRLQ